jgi:hypothetical protein
MAKKDVFDTAKRMCMLSDVYGLAVAEEIGKERELALNTKVMEKMGANAGNTMKKQSGIKKFDAKTAWPAVKTTCDNLGIGVKVVEESPKKVAVKIGKCPVYEAGHECGIDNKTLESHCRSGSIRYLDVLVKQLNPNLTHRLVKYRSGPDDFCEEETVIE